MDRATSVETAVELTASLLSSVQLDYIPVKSQAEGVGDFVEALAARLEKISLT